jgi:glucose-6-phosphate isomerase
LLTRSHSLLLRAALQGRKINPQDGFNPSTERMLNKYLQGKTQLLYPEPKDVFPADLISSTKRPTSYN